MSWLEDIKELQRDLAAPAKDLAGRKKNKRSRPGDPRCENCRKASRGACREHKDFHYEYDPMDSLAVPAPPNPDGHWYPV